MGRKRTGLKLNAGFIRAALSPYLFILCSELLSLALHERTTGLGISVCPTAPMVSHLLFGDDILIFAEDSISSANRISEILKEYCKWTGQKVHPDKSAIMFSKSMVRWKGGRISRHLGYRQAHELDYLGVKLATRKLHSRDFPPLIQKCRNTTLAWGNRHLSLAGRTTLINATLLAMPMFTMTHMRLPKGVMADVEKIGRSFLWDKGPSVRGLHFLKWHKLCQPSLRASWASTALLLGAVPCGLGLCGTSCSIVEVY